MSIWVKPPKGISLDIYSFNSEAIVDSLKRHFERNLTHKRSRDGLVVYCSDKERAQILASSLPTPTTNTSYHISFTTSVRGKLCISIHIFAASLVRFFEKLSKDILYKRISIRQGIISYKIIPSGSTMERCPRITTKSSHKHGKISSFSKPIKRFYK